MRAQFNLNRRKRNRKPGEGKRDGPTSFRSRMPMLWRWIVNKTRDSTPFFLAFATVCGVVPGVIGYFVMQTTNSGNQQLEAELRRNARPESMRMGQVNKERLAEFLGELQRKENTNDRYVAALKGETLTRNPYVRIQPIPKPSNTESEKEQK